MNVGNSLRKESKRDVTPVISIRGYRRGVVAYLFFSGNPTAYYQHLSFQPYAFFFATTRPRGANGRQKLFIMKRFLFVLAAMNLLFTACEDGSDDYIKLKEVDDVCTMMDDLDFMAYCYEEFDVNKDGKVSMEEAAAVGKIYPNWKYDIHSVKGIEYFSNVEIIEFYDNLSYDINLSFAKKLRRVTLRFNESKFKDLSQKVSINLGNNTTLEYLYLLDVNLDNLDLSKCKGLTEIELQTVAVNNLNLANGNEILAGLYWLRSDISSPTLTIWLKSGQVLKEKPSNKGYKYTIKYID